MSLFRRQGCRRRRRGYAIHAYVGPNGGGKSAAAVWDTMPSLDAGRSVLSTVRLLDYDNPRLCDDLTCDSPDHETHMAAHPLWIPWHRWSQLLEVERCDVIADEVTGVASSRDSGTMPARVANELVQLRRKDVILRWTAPHWNRADVIIRECSQAATLCSGFFPVQAADDDGTERAWRHRRMFRWLTYDAALVDDLTEGKRESIGPEVVDWFWGPGSPVFSAYDTFDSVSTLGAVADIGGRCETCHGRRSAPSCSCPEYLDRPRRTRAGRSGGSPLAGSAPGTLADAVADLDSGSSGGLVDDVSDAPVPVLIDSGSPPARGVSP